MLVKLVNTNDLKSLAFILLIGSSPMRRNNSDGIFLTILIIFCFAILVFFY
jgi:hypothetical protein